jgi:pimeloyl-[acyl-carrier protein] synthase
MQQVMPIQLSRVEEIGNRIIEQINALREVSPIYWSEEEQGWVITGHQEVTEAYSGELPLSAARFKILLHLFPDEEERNKLIPNLMRYFPHFLIMLDGDQHTRIRRLLMSGFSKKVVERYRPHARDVIKRVLDGLEGKTEVEFVEEIGREITARNIMRIMGLEDEEYYLPKLKEWAYLANAAGGARPTPELLARADNAFKEMADALLPEIERRRQNPTDDFVSTVVNARDGDDYLSNDELIGELILVLLAGHDTTLNTMALSLNALSKDPAAREHLYNHPETQLNSIMELMRYIAMSTHQARIVAEDFEWKGHQLKQGQIVHIMTAGANRDPRVFAEPERLDLSRNQEKNMTFAPGAHHCIGHLFAKLQLTEFFPEFLRRYESFDILSDPIQFGGGLTFRGPQEVRMRLHPRKS